MVIRVKEAIKEALDEIQKLGYVILSVRDNEHVEIFWPGQGEPPAIDQLLEIIQTDQEALEVVLSERSVPIPAWLFLGYPWDHSAAEWKKMERESTLKSKQLASIHRRYAEACISFYKNKHDTSWKSVVWDEPWPIVS